MSGGGAQGSGASVPDRAVVPSASSPAVSTVPASIPSAGDVFEIRYPFVRDTYSSFDAEGSCEVPTWKPGVNYVWVSEDHTAPVADEVGQAIFTVVDAFKPGRFPTRVFFTRKFVNPDGHSFGKPRLHIATLDKFRRLTRGYQHPFGIGEPLLSDRQWWSKADAEREFMQMLAEHASAMSAGTAETLQAAQGDSPPARAVGDAQNPPVLKD